MLEYGVDLDVIDVGGNIVFYYVVRGENLLIVVKLFLYNVNIEVRNKVEIN